MVVTKQKETWEEDEQRISIPPPAYSHQLAPPPLSFSSPPPPSYHRIDDDSRKTKSQLDEESWSMVMQKPFYQRWAYLLRSWGQVLWHGKWAFCAFLFPLFFVTILVLYILPPSHT